MPSGYNIARQTSLPRGPGEERTADSRERQRLSPQTASWAQAAGKGTDVGGKKEEARKSHPIKDEDKTLLVLDA